MNGMQSTLPIKMDPTVVFIFNGSAFPPLYFEVKWQSTYYWVYWKIFAVKSGNYNWVLTLNPRGQILHMNAPRKALIAWNFGDKMIALDTARNSLETCSNLARTSLELARLLPAKLEGGKRVASSDLRVHVPRMGTSSQSSLYMYMYVYTTVDLHVYVTCTRMACICLCIH